MNLPVYFNDMTSPIQSQVTDCNIDLGAAIGPDWSLNKNTRTITLRLTEKPWTTFHFEDFESLSRIKYLIFIQSAARTEFKTKTFKKLTNP